MRTVLTIAGSDSSAGAGAQLDLRVFSALGLHGASVLTALTAQNTQGVRRIFAVPPRFIAAQIDAVTDDFDVQAVKIGMLHRAPVVTAVVQRLKRLRLPNVVLDPVILASDGRPLLAPKAVEALRQRLLPLAAVVTPNLPEAERLTGVAIRDAGDLERAAKLLLETGVGAVLIKGGHREGPAVDTLFTRDERHEFPGERLDVGPVHGTGCALSSAVAGYLALGEELPTACRRAKQLVAGAIRTSHKVGQGARVMTFPTSRNEDHEQ